MKPLPPSPLYHSSQALQQLVKENPRNMVNDKTALHQQPHLQVGVTRKTRLRQ